MFKRLELKNFRQHSDLTLHFEPGIVAIRGANESGKTSLLEAIAYAWFGATVLRQSLDKTVTRGAKESSLKVTLDFSLNGDDFTVTRSKAGAELTQGVKIVATGQTEVRKFVESLLGASAETVTNLMMAKQKDLEGTLGQAPGASVKLIETLANFSLIDTIIALAQSNLPTGATSHVEARIADLDEKIAQGVVDETGTFQVAHEQAAAAEAAAEAAYDAAYAEYAQHYPLAEAAEKRENALVEMVKVVGRRETERQNAATTLSLISLNPNPPTAARVEAVREAVAKKKLWAEAQAAWAALEQADAALAQRLGPAGRLACDPDSYQASLSNAQQAVDGARTACERSRQEIVKLQAQIISDSGCKLCGKDLQDVPEVVTKNAATTAAIEGEEAVLAGHESRLAEAQAALQRLQLYSSAQGVYLRAVQPYAKFVDLVYETVPPTWQWKGPDLTEAAPTATEKELADLTNQLNQFQRDQGRKTQAEAALATAVQALTEAKVELDSAKVHSEADQATLQKAAGLLAAVTQAEQTLDSAQEATKSALQQLRQANAVLAERQRALDALKASLEQAQKDLAEMGFNNDLLKRLRDIRPEITNELWGMSQAAISHYFSQIRGTPSKVQREGSTFTVDGIEVAGLSGSAQDALGMSIRIALTRMFLPNTSFFVLDEPAAAADEQRETNMLGLIATCEFQQVLLVTHSDLIDSYANQVIRL